MDIKASLPVSNVAASPSRQGQATIPVAGSGNDLPLPVVSSYAPVAAPAPASPHLDQAVIQSQEDRQAAVAQRVNAYLRSVSRDLEFQVDSASGKAVITVKDASGNVVRTIPGEDAMQMLRRANVELGTFVDSMV